MTTKNRLQFDLTDSAFDRYQEIKEQTGSRTGAELFRNAIRLYGWFVKKRLEGYSIVLRKGKREIEVELLE